MRRRDIGFATAALSVATLLSVPVEATATHNCVSRFEYQRVHRGMAKPRVHFIFDTAGVRLDLVRRADGSVDEWRGYRLCWTARRAAVLNYDNYTQPGPGMRLFSKVKVPV